MTANAMPSDRDVCLNAGMTDFVSKPINAKAFLAIVLAILESHASTLQRESTACTETETLDTKTGPTA
jgi:CheY-like chemotaxis protein